MHKRGLVLFGAGENEFFERIIGSMLSRRNRDEVLVLCSVTMCVLQSKAE